MERDRSRKQCVCKREWRRHRRTGESSSITEHGKANKTTRFCICMNKNSRLINQLKVVK